MKIEEIYNDVNNWLWISNQIKFRHTICIGDACKILWDNLSKKTELIRIKELILAKNYLEARKAYADFLLKYPEFKK